MKNLTVTQLGAMALVLVMAAMPIVLDNKALTYFLALVLIWGIFALSFDLIFGVTGMLSFGHAALFGMGAYTFAILAVGYSWPFWASIVAAMSMASILGASLSALGARTSGLYFGLATLAMSEMVSFVATSQLRSLTGGADGIAGVPRPSIFGVSLVSERSFYCFILVVASAYLLLMYRLHRSQFGFILAAIRQNENRVAQLGINPARFKVLAFALSGCGCGLAGALLGSQMSYVGPQALHWSTSGDVLMMTVLGGAGTLLGPIVGVFVVEVLKSILSGYTTHWYGILGVLFVLATIFLPKGIVPSVRLLIKFHRRGPK